MFVCQTNAAVSESPLHSPNTKVALSQEPKANHVATFLLLVLHYLCETSKDTKRLCLLLSSKLLKMLAALLVEPVLNAPLVLLEIVPSVESVESVASAEKVVAAPTTLSVAPLLLPLALALKAMDLLPLASVDLVALVVAVDLADLATTTIVLVAPVPTLPPTLLVKEVDRPAPTTTVAVVDLVALALLVEMANNNIALRTLAEKVNNNVDPVEMVNNNIALRDLATAPLVAVVDPADLATTAPALLPLVPVPLALPLLNKRRACW